jgi:acyl-CoA synthetase (AMP-forming)/AMP-acid ligase II
MDITALTRKGAQQFADSIAVSFEGKSLTYAQLFERSCRLANALDALGVRPGERVATMCDNSLEAVELITGVALGGYVRAALYTHNSAESNLYQLDDLIEASVLLIDAAHYEHLAAPLAHAKHPRHVLVLGGPAPPGTLDYEHALAGAAATDPRVVPRPSDPHVIRFSAGTTGKPKGILHTVEGWRNVATEAALTMPRLTPDDRYLAAGPLSHAAQLPIYPILAAGGSIVIMRAFHPERFLELVERERCTTTLLVPTMIQMIVHHPAAATADVSSLRGVFYGASPISEQTMTEARALWGDVLYQGYGQSEVAVLTTLGPRDHIPASTGSNRLRSAGRPTPNTVIRIVDEDGNDLPTGTIGEIAARTPAAMAGIWRDPDATAERFLPDGSILTRDMGYLDEDGFLYLADRKEDMIISGGFNIWPAELENALASHPAVAQVAVVGVPHDKWGETPKAVVVLRPGQHTSAEELIDWTRDKVGAIKRATSVDFAEDLPKSPLGKVLRREVRARCLAMLIPGG